MVADPQEAKNQPVQKLGVLFGLIVMRGWIAMVSQYKTVKHLVTNDLATNPYAKMPLNAVTGILKKTVRHHRVWPPLNAIKSLLAANQPLRSGRILATSHPLRYTDQISQGVASHDDPLYPKNVTVKRTMHPRKAVKAHWNDGDKYLRSYLAH